MRSSGTWFVVWCVAASVVYGWLHDAVTAQVCPEYFLPPYHPVLIATESPLALAAIWGVVATFWAGLALGVMLALANSLGSARSFPWRWITRRLLWGLCGSLLVAYAILGVVMGLSARIPTEIRQPTFEVDRRLVAVALAHQWSYAATVTWACMLMTWIVWKRVKRQGLPTDIPL